MTAEVAIMNKLAVALAADSAVTVGVPGKVKIFTGANKIFTLSKYAPVGVMINGHVEHFGVPWELVLKTFREELGKTRCGTVEEYAHRLRDYISSPMFMTEDGQEFRTIVAAYESYAELRRRLNERGRHWTSKSINSTLDEMEHHLYNERTYIQAFSDLTYRKFVLRYGAAINEAMALREILPRPIPTASQSRFRRVVHLALVHNLPGNFSTGVVVAGFGEDELFPALKETTFDGGIMGIMRCIDGAAHTVDRERNTVFLSGFAQDDAVNAFRFGVDEDYEKYSLRMTKTFLNSFAEELLKEHTEHDEVERKLIMKTVSEKLESSVSEFRKTLIKFSINKYSDPISDMLRSAPKDELASVAEALVNLTSLRRRVSLESETVAGPIDVAIISRGDGFIWIKRKHYFSRELNHHFLRNYFEDGGSHAGANEE